MTYKVNIELHCMRCRMTVRGTIEVDPDGDEAYLQQAVEGARTKARCPICGPAYPRQKIMEVTLGRRVVKLKTPADYRAEAKAAKDALQDPALCPYRAGDRVRVAFRGFSQIGGMRESDQTVMRVTPKGGVRLSDGYLYRPERKSGGVEYHYWSQPMPSSPLITHGKILGPSQPLLGPPPS